MSDITWRAGYCPEHGVHLEFSAPTGLVARVAMPVAAARVLSAALRRIVDDAEAAISIPPALQETAGSA